YPLQGLEPAVPQFRYQFSQRRALHLGQVGCLSRSSNRAIARFSASILSSGFIAAAPGDWTSIDGPPGDGSAEIGARHRMPKPAKKNREGHCLCRMVLRQLQQYDDQVHTTSSSLQQSALIGGTGQAIGPFAVCAVAGGVGVTSKWPYI